MDFPEGWDSHLFLEYLSLVGASPQDRALYLEALGQRKFTFEGDHDTWFPSFTSALRGRVLSHYRLQLCSVALSQAQATGSGDTSKTVRERLLISSDSDSLGGLLQ